MKTIYIDNENIPFFMNGLSIAIGFFDGVHEGHKVLINKALESSEYECGVVTFSPSPYEMINKVSVSKQIAPICKKEELLSELGVDYLLVIKFDEYTASLEKKEFVDKFLIGMNVKNLVCGFDWKYGHKGLGTTETLITDSEDYFKVNIIEAVKYQGRKISSSWIKECLTNGNIELANTLLGREYNVEGNVCLGAQIGRTIGFPTANIDLDSRYILPKNGVYLVRVLLNDELYFGMANIGYNPTINKVDVVRLEVHILDFDRDIYGERLEVSFVKRIRDEVLFNSVDELIVQLESDKKLAYDYINNSEV